MKQGSGLSGTLHLLNKAPGHHRFTACLEALSADDTLVLMENAVIAVTDQRLSLPAHTAALKDDLVARGIPAPQAILEIGFHDMVQLTDRFERIISW